MRIGFIGLGIMGSRMAANLIKAGYDLVIYNRTAAKAKPLLDAGAEWSDTPAELATQVDLVFTVLAHPDAVAEMALPPPVVCASWTLLSPDQRVPPRTAN
jgi:3-hydroxyisobutyrate dehydrogenase-like beta-hydroxyacid dehydrogenase